MIEQGKKKILATEKNNWKEKYIQLMVYTLHILVNWGVYLLFELDFLKNEFVFECPRFYNVVW